MAPPSDSPVRIPTDLLERAERFDPENRAEVVRRAVSLGLDEMEKEKTLQSAKDVKRMISAALASDPILRDLVEQQVRKLTPVHIAGKVRGISSFYRLNEFEKKKADSSPVFSLKAGEVVELVVPPPHSYSYVPVDLKFCSFDSDAKIEVSKLSSDGGVGRDLFASGWHQASEFGGAATALVRHKHVSTTDLRMFIRSDRDTVVAVSLVLEVEKCGLAPRTPDLTGQPGLAWGEPKTTSTSGRLVRIPFEEIGGQFRTKPAHWGMLRVRGIVFDGERNDLLSTAFCGLQVLGSPPLDFNDGWGSAAHFTERDLLGGLCLRMTPMLIAPNVASVQLISFSRVFQEAFGGVHGAWSWRQVVPYLVCEVVQDFG